MPGELQRLIRTGVQRPDDDLVTGERVEHLAVDVSLLLDAGFGVAVEEAQFGAEQTDSVGRRLAGAPGGRAVLNVGQDRDRVPVRGRTGTRPAGCELSLL